MLKRSARPEAATVPIVGTEAVLNVATVYQDLLTQRWAAKLWDQVGQLIGGGDVCHKSWMIRELARPGVFVEAVRAAAQADVLVVSLRDAEVLPLNLYTWIDGWLPQRAGRGGALVALVGVPAQPDAECGHTQRLLEAVARSAGLDFLPREQKIPDGCLAAADAPNTASSPEAALTLPGRERDPSPQSRLHWGLKE